MRLADLLSPCAVPVVVGGPHVAVGGWQPRAVSQVLAGLPGEILQMLPSDEDEPTQLASDAVVIEAIADDVDVDAPLEGEDGGDRGD